MKALTGLCVVVAVVGQGCATAGGCSDVGGFSGVTADIPRALFVSSGSVAFDVCDADGCASASAPLGPVPEGPVGRAASVTFDDLGRDFEPGQVTVSVTLSNADGRVVATAGRDIELTRSYPNGEACDGAGYVGGSLNLNRDDRV